MSAVRKRQPEITRQKLLETAATLAAESGVAALTLDAVAHQAGVSKGGLLHHFADKAALVSAMAQQLNARFFAAVETHAAADADARGRGARAYVRAIASEEPNETKRWAALTGAFFLDHALVDEWRQATAAARAQDQAEADDPERAMIARLAADGLWFASVFGLYDIDDALRRRIADALIAMTR